MITVTKAVKPTNAHLAETLNHILRDLSEVKKTQAQLAAELRKLAQQTGTK